MQVELVLLEYKVHKDLLDSREKLDLKAALDLLEVKVITVENMSLQYFIIDHVFWKFVS